MLLNEIANVISTLFGLFPGEALSRFLSAPPQAANNSLRQLSGACMRVRDCCHANG